MQTSMFKELHRISPDIHRFGEGAHLLHGFALQHEKALLDALEAVVAKAPLRHMHTPGGLRMSVAMTNCGELGWVSDHRGYRYESVDPVSGKHWPGMPKVFSRLALHAASAAGFDNFDPDVCLVNHYVPGTKLSLHQDKDEHDFSKPIVSVSLGLPAVFLFGGQRRADRPQRIPLLHGDVVVWGAASRLRYHGVLPIKDGRHPLLGGARYNLTFRKAG